jgi:hypothetical protein
VIKGFPAGTVTSGSTMGSAVGRPSVVGGSGVVTNAAIVDDVVTEGTEVLSGDDGEVVVGSVAIVGSDTDVCESGGAELATEVVVDTTIEPVSAVEV